MRLYREGRAAPHLTDRIVIIVDDGLATGSSMRAAVRAVRRERPALVVVAVPVAPTDTCALLRLEADECVCASTQDPFFSVGELKETDLSGALGAGPLAGNPRRSRRVARSSGLVAGGEGEDRSGKGPGPVSPYHR